MADEHLGTKQFRSNIVNNFLTMYHHMIEELQQNMDHRQLGLRSDHPFEDDHEKDALDSKSEYLVKVLSNWEALGVGINVVDSISECHNFDKCFSLKRLLFLMGLFAQHTMGLFVGDVDDGNHSAEDEGNDVDFIDIIHCLSGYDEIGMLNDLEHVRDHKGKFPSLQCEHGNDAAECIGEMLRQYRGDDSDNSMDSTVKEYLDGLNLKEKSVLNTCSRIHSFLYHEDHASDDETEDSLHMKRPITAREKKEITSKFVNEINERKSESRESKRMDTLFTDLAMNGFSNSKHAEFMANLYDQRYDSEAIIQDLVSGENDPFNHYKDSNLFPLLQRNPFLAKNIKKHFNVKGSDDDDMMPFSFGKHRLYHWKGSSVYPFEDRPGYVGNPRHSSLKEECLNNNIHPMTMRQFSEMLWSACSFRNCAKGRAFKAMDHGGYNYAYGVRKNSPLSVRYIFVLLMYCNLTDLQYKYKKIGCRERDDEQTLEELIEWNKEIAIWHRHLFEVVHFFGELASPHQVYYTGLNTKLAFPSFAPVFNCPISTTGLFFFAVFHFSLFIPFCSIYEQ